jgi:hypothetical protein
MTTFWTTMLFLSIKRHDFLQKNFNWKSLLNMVWIRFRIWIQNRNRNFSKVVSGPGNYSFGSATTAFSFNVSKGWHLWYRSLSSRLSKFQRRPVFFTFSVNIAKVTSMIWWYSYHLHESQSCIVVAPDPVGAETFGRIRFWIQKNHFRSGHGQLRIRNEFEIRIL